MDIEPLCETDMEPLRAIFNEARSSTTGLPSVELSMQEFREQLEGEETFVARIKGDAAAFVSVWVQASFIHHLYVSPRHQARGLGKQLVLFTEKEYGRPLYLKCGAANANAQEFYERTGWVALSRAVGPDGPYINYVLPDATQE